MKKNKLFSVLVCLIFIFNSFTFNVYALSDETSSKAIENVKIISSVNASLEAVEAWARSKNATETFVNLAKIYKKYAESRGGVNWVVAYVQAAKETGYGKFGGVLDESYHNPCGLKNPSGGADNDANAHKRFDNWNQGVIAHLDHLALYAAASGYPKTVYVDSWKDSSLSSNETYDPRHIGWFGTADGILGKAKDVLSLTGSWASDPNYGEALIKLYCDAINFKYLPTRSDLELPTNSEVVTNDKLRIKGWALAEEGVKEIKVLIDNSQVATINADVNRPDIDSKYPEYVNGVNSGFDKIIDISKFEAGNRTVEVKIVFKNGEAQSYKRNIVIKRAESEKELPFRSTLDEPVTNEKVTSDKLKIRGWALANSGIKEVRVYVDGKDLGTVPYGTSRADVNKVYPGYSSGNNPGFDGTINVSSISAGNKKLTVKITANDGTTQTIERTIKIEKLPSVSCLDEPTSNLTVKENKLKIRGWALANSGVKEVRVYVDGKDLGTVPYGTSRADVNKVYPGYSSGNNPGFDGTINLGGVPDGTKKLTIKITANDGTIQNIERNFNYRKTKLVVIDPGHEIESVDKGAVATHNGVSYIEGNLNLQIAVKLKAELEAKGIQVYMTREGNKVIDNDSTESLRKRVNVANEMEADLFVSIHHNSFTSPSANGFEVYYSTGTPITTYISNRMVTKEGRDLTLEARSYSSRNNTEKVVVSKELATEITNESSAALDLYNRGAKDSNFYVCKNTKMPSILIENGFLTNQTEAEKVSTSRHQQRLAEITAKRIIEVLN
ncbi:N-acetylmuramoyl-L-alanine amidase [uncultured Clostridium sp.]|uniref:N-acetylmuramoyl-L-alanine amidase n=7 Tax=Clostridium TaxID=1485 RepID=UPI0026141C84|nr:N-acetylmuramoyl-L-alanine amidase [uncultured Clostridium sp.]